MFSLKAVPMKACNDNAVNNLLHGESFGSADGRIDTHGGHPRHRIDFIEDPMIIFIEEKIDARERRAAAGKVDRLGDFFSFLKHIFGKRDIGNRGVACTGVFIFVGMELFRSNDFSRIRDFVSNESKFKLAPLHFFFDKKCVIEFGNGGNGTGNLRVGTDPVDTKGRSEVEGFDIEGKRKRAGDLGDEGLGISIQDRIENSMNGETLTPWDLAMCLVHALSMVRTHDLKSQPT